MTDELNKLQCQIHQYRPFKKDAVAVDNKIFPRSTHINRLKQRLHRGLRRARQCYIEHQCQAAAEAFRIHDIRSVYQVLRDLTNTEVEGFSTELLQLRCDVIAPLL